MLFAKGPVTGSYTVASASDDDDALRGKEDCAVIRLVVLYSQLLCRISIVGRLRIVLLEGVDFLFLWRQHRTGVASAFPHLLWSTCYC